MGGKQRTKPKMGNKIFGRTVRIAYKCTLRLSGNARGSGTQEGSWVGGVRIPGSGVQG